MSSQKALTNALLGKIPLIPEKAKEEAPPYPDTGVDYAGYSKEVTQGGWRLRPQSQFWAKIRLVHPWLASYVTIFLNEKKALFITKYMIDWNMLIGSGIQEVHFSPTGNTADSLSFFRVNMAYRTWHMTPYDFDPPIRFDRICNVIINGASTGATEEVNILIWGYSEEL